VGKKAAGCLFRWPSGFPFKPFPGGRFFLDFFSQRSFRPATGLSTLRVVTGESPDEHYHQREECGVEGDKGNQDNEPLDEKGTYACYTWAHASAGVKTNRAEQRHASSRQLNVQENVSNEKRHTPHQLAVSQAAVEEVGKWIKGHPARI
jgi:hypothetical protein